MILAHRIRLDPNNIQATHLARAAGTARFACNWALAEWQRQFEARKANPALPKPNEAALRRQLNAIKREQFSWMLEVTRCAPQIAIMQLGRAFQNFFEGRAHYPKVGVDLGVTMLATLSTGETFAGPKARRSLLQRLQRLSRSLSRKVKGSRNRAKAKIRLARLHARIANVRRDGLHQLSTSITRRFHTIGIEDLNVKGMLGNRCLARAIADMGWYELRRQLEYKAARRGGRVVEADRWYPSSKTCSCCG